MPTREELERLSLPDLAVLCRKVADDPSTPTAVKEGALGLEKKWALLQMPMSAQLSEQREVEQKQAALKKRMVEFLAAL